MSLIHSAQFWWGCLSGGGGVAAVVIFTKLARDLRGRRYG